MPKPPTPRRRSVIWLVAMFLAALFAVSAATFAAPKEYRITALEVQGTRQVQADAVLAVIGMKVGDMYTEEALSRHLKEVDLKAIAAMGLFADQAARTAQYKGGIKVTFELVENPYIKSIVISGASRFTEKELLRLMRTQPNQVLNTNTLQEDLRRITAHYLQAGNLVKVAKMDADKGDRLVISLIERRIERIVLTGNKKTKDYVIKRELLSKERELVDLEKIKTEQRNLLALGFFTEITPDLREGSTPEGLIYTISVTERETGGAAGGVGYGSSEGVLGYLEVAEQNVLGRAQVLSIRMELGSRGSRLLEARFLEPWLDEKRTSLGLNLYNRTTPRLEATMDGGDPKPYTEVRLGGDVVFTRPVGEDTKVSILLKGENTKSIDDSGKSLDVPGDGDTRSVTLTSYKDTRDNLMNPTKGYMATASMEVAGRVLGGDNTFSKFTISGSTYLPIQSKLVAALRLAAGQAFHTGVLAVQERFRIGGADTIRGLGYGTVQGDAMVYANAELRFPVYKALSGVVFVDVGDAWFTALSKPKPKTGFGLGVRLDTPLGLMRLDYGICVSPGGAVKGEAAFSIGQAF